MKNKFFYILAALMMTAAGKINATTRHFWVPDEINRPIDNTAYRNAIKEYVRGYFYGGKEGREKILKEYHYMFNRPRYIEVFKTLPVEYNPVQQFEYDKPDGSIGLLDSITPEKTIFILTIVDEKYGYDAPATDSLYITYFNEDGNVGWWSRLARENEQLHWIKGMKIRSDFCGQETVTTLAEYEAMKRAAKETAKTNKTTTTDPYTVKADPNGATIRISRDSLGNGDIVIPIAISAGNNNGNNNGNGNIQPADTGTFRPVDRQWLIDDGYQNVPVEADCFWYGDVGCSPGYCYTVGGSWGWCGGTPWWFSLARVQCLYTNYCNNGYQGYGFQNNSSGQPIVINNYNYNTNVNNNTVNTNPNPHPRPSTSGGHPVGSPNGDLTGGGPTGAPNGTASGRPAQGPNRQTPPRSMQSTTSTATNSRSVTSPGVTTARPPTSRPAASRPVQHTATTAPSPQTRQTVNHSTAAPRGGGGVGRPR